MSFSQNGKTGYHWKATFILPRNWWKDERFEVVSTLIYPNARMAMEAFADSGVGECWNRHKLLIGRMPSEVTVIKAEINATRRKR